ncbi:MAG: phenylalanine--tRNA ligase subunit alpha [Nitrososphaerales archaeon]
MQPLHLLEKKILRALSEVGQADLEGLISSSKLSEDQVRRAIEWLQAKGFIQLNTTQKNLIALGSKGLEALKEGLPERRLIQHLKKGVKNLVELKGLFKDEQEFSASLGRAKRRGWIKITNDCVELVNEPSRLPEEDLLEKLSVKQNVEEEELVKDKVLYEGVKELLSRPNYLSKKVVKKVQVSLTEQGKAALKSIVEEEELDALTPETIISGIWRQKRLRAIDVEAPAPPIYAGRRHPVQLFIDEVREIFISMGFEEIEGSLIQPCFWNFDALFTPQDHPAREMQDTFYIKGVAQNYADKEEIAKVSATHKDGWRTGSRGWGYNWREDEAKKLVLRTHTTSITVRYLAEHKPKEARVFTVGRVFRNEKVTFKNLVEFHQIEGIAVGPRLTLRDLMGLLSTFYRRLGLEKVKFWPTFFPYTEPSMQSVVYYDKTSKWIELCGMGIFRPEVTLPFGVKNPVLAWGGGLERLVMMKYDLDDVRELYANRLSWLRRSSLCL